MDKQVSVQHPNALPDTKDDLLFANPEYTPEGETSTAHNTDSLPAVQTYMISANVKGLSVSGTIVISYMDIHSKTISSKDTIDESGTFTFSTPIANGGVYAIVIEKHPAGQMCTLNKSTGLVEGSDVSDIEIDCTDLPSMSVSFMDNNFEWDHARGNIHITRAPDETNIQSYVLSWGTGGGKGFGCLSLPIIKMGTIVEIEKVGKDIDYYLNNTGLLYQMRRHIILEYKDANGDLGGRVTTSIKEDNVGCGFCCQQGSNIDAVASKDESYMNWFGTESVKPQEILYPENLGDLTDIVRRACEAKKRVRMAGSSLSISDITITNDILLRPIELEGRLNLDPDGLVEKDNKFLVRFLSGTRVRTINQILEQNDLALGILGGFDGQTIIGLAMTSTHGSSLNYGPISDSVVSLQIVGENGEVFQVEPSKGITNPDAFSGVLEEKAKDGKNIPITLIQDDDSFNAILVSGGSMGIVYSAVLRAEPKFWIHEECTVLFWNEFKSGFLDKIFAHGKDCSKKLEESREDPYYYEFLVNPYEEEDGRHSVLLTKRWKYTEKIYDDDDPCFRGKFGNKLGTQAVLHTQKGLEALMNHHPKIAVDAVGSALEILSDESYNNISHRVFHIGNANYVDVKAIELHFDIKDTVAVIERMFQTASELKDKGVVQNVPLACRFIKSSESFISMQNGRDTLSVEIIVLQGLDGGAELLKRYEAEYVEDPGFMARPHWGLTLNYLQGEDAARRLYPNTWDRWMEKYRLFNKGTFDGKFTDRLGISINPV